MLKYPCLVLDHDDTVVASEITVNYPCFLEALNRFRPGEYMSYPEMVKWCFKYEFNDFLNIRFGFTPEECQEEFLMWKEYAKTHIPPACDGVREIIQEHKRRGGIICVASLNSRKNIERDYDLHFGIQPDMIFCKDDPIEQCKPGPYPIRKIMETYHFSPSQILVVDDLKTGLKMANAAGVPIAFAGWCRQEAPDILKYMGENCDFAFDTTKELYEFLFDS